EVEVEHEPAVVFPEIRSFHRVEEIAAAAVALPPARRVAEAEEEPAAVALQPVELQGQRLASQREVSARERLEQHRLGPARLDRLRRSLDVLELGEHARLQVVVEVVEALVAGPPRLRVRAE